MSTFEAYFNSAIQAAALAPRPLMQGECQSSSTQRCRLCAAVKLDYADELRIKNDALQKFWASLQMPVPLQPIVASPLGRGYRTVSKRKVFLTRGSLALALIDTEQVGTARSFEPVYCAVEPAEHNGIFQTAGNELQKTYVRPLAEELGYVVIKGSYEEFAVILNVRQISPPIVKAANTLSKALTRKWEKITGLFLYEGDSSGRYYLGRRNDRSPGSFRKIFGKGNLYQRIQGRSFVFSPLSFSQVNASIIEPMVSAAAELLALNPEATLVDLYCGYGLFSLCLAEKARAVIGIELSPESVAAAIANAERQHSLHVRFIRSDITAPSMAKLLKTSGPNDRFLLDPPRRGTAPGVIDCLAARGPAKALHIFCNIDLVPQEIERWRTCNYRLSRAIPFDMFPGTCSIELMTLLEPG